MFRFCGGAAEGSAVSSTPQPRPRSVCDTRIGNLYGCGAAAARSRARCDRLVPGTKKRQSLTFGTQSSRRRFAKQSSLTFKEGGMALKDLLVCIDPTSVGDVRLKLAF